MYVPLLTVAFLVGSLLAVQTSVNLQLSASVRTPYGAATVQLGVAAVLLTVLAVVAGTLGALRFIADAQWWQLLGGLASPLYITSGILLFPRFGALASVGLFVTGQMFASVGLDEFGLIGVPRQPFTAGIVLGAVAVVGGITVIIRAQRPAPAAVPATVMSSVGAMAQPAVGTGVATAGWIGLGLTAGAVLPIQGAVNAQLRTALDQPITVALFSFAVATIAITLVLSAMLALGKTPTPQLSSLRHMPWWGWLGGACAAAYVTAAFLLIPQIGAATTVALTVTGQQVASAVVDHFGLFRMAKRPMTTRRLTGLALLVIGSVLVQIG
jgi:transporter family-2 protein